MKILGHGLLIFLVGMSISYAQELANPIMEIPDEDLDTCALGQVVRLNPDGDNFLAVRTGPGTQFDMIDKIHTGDQVWIFNQDGNWFGVVYDADFVECSPVDYKREYNGPGKKGWVFQKFVEVVAG